jgi:cell division protein FtsI/penicillin-binding protein 2
LAKKLLNPRRRADILFGLLLAGHLLVAGRLFHIQVLDRARYQKLADKYHVRNIRIPGHRGVIKDRNGELLAINADAGSISLDPSFYWDETKFPMVTRDGKRVRQAPDKDAAARQIAEALGIRFEEIRPKLDKRTRFVWIKRHVSLENVRRADAANIPGLQIDDELRRVYPMGSLAAHILGSTGIDGQGLAGIEMRYDSVLARTDGVEVLEVDRKGRVIPGTLRSVREPQDGADVTLTIDARIQQGTIVIAGPGPDLRRQAIGQLGHDIADGRHPHARQQTAYRGEGGRPGAPHNAQPQIRHGLCLLHGTCPSGLAAGSFPISSLWRGAPTAPGGRAPRARAAAAGRRAR